MHKIRIDKKFENNFTKTKKKGKFQSGKEIIFLCQINHHPNLAKKIYTKKKYN